MSKAVLYTDGGARGNPGPAGIGFVLTIGENQEIVHGESIGTATNNVAEYVALQRGLARAKQEGVDQVQCFLDSELVVRQLKGEYKVKSATLRELHQRVKAQAREFKTITFEHVLRHKNKQADALLNKALDEETKKSRTGVAGRI